MVTYGEKKAPKGPPVEVPFNVPREWEGETCFILGGGSSLKAADVERIRGLGRVIALKDAGLYLAPWADVLYWADLMWTEGDGAFPGRWDELEKFEGKYKITRARGLKKCQGHEIYYVNNTVRMPLSRKIDTLAGPDSGSNAINLAFLFGAARIVLLGFDMRGPNWDGRHRYAEDNNAYATRFMPFLAKMANQLAGERIEVLNASPISRLTCFPMVKLEELIPMARRGRPRKKAPTDDAFTSPEEYEGGETETEEGDGGALEPEEGAQAPGATVIPEKAEDAVEAPRSEPDGPVTSGGSTDFEGREVKEISGLELLEPLGVRDMVRALGNEHEEVIFKVRTGNRPDVVTRRPASWWKLIFGTAYDRVTEFEPTSGGSSFLCQKIKV